MLKKLAKQCRECSYKDTCNNKQMEAHGQLEPLGIDMASDMAMEISAPISSPMLVNHDYRDIKVGENTTITIDLEDLKKQMEQEFYNSLGLGLINGG